MTLLHTNVFKVLTQAIQLCFQIVLSGKL